MLYVHCGWPRTSTTSIQNALRAHGTQLADEKLIYIDRSTSGKAGELLRDPLLLRSKADLRGPLDELKSFFSANSDKNVLLSNENFAVWQVVDGNRQALMRLLTELKSMVQLRCVWTLRRFDEVKQSIYLRGMTRQVQQAPLPEVLGKIYYLDQLFAGMRDIEEAVDDQVTYVKYESSGLHNEALLRAFGVPESLRVEIGAEMRVSRLNGSPTHKAAVVLTNLEVLSRKAGFDLDDSSLRELFRCGEFQFEEDWPCELFDVDVKEDLHKRALAAAERNQITAYTDFFEKVEVGNGLPVSSGLDPEIISDDDLRHLVAYLRRES